MGAHMCFKGIPAFELYAADRAGPGSLCYMGLHMSFEPVGAGKLFAANGAEIVDRVGMGVHHMGKLLVGAVKLLAEWTNRHWLLLPIFMVRSPVRMRSSEWCQCGLP